MKNIIYIVILLFSLGLSAQTVAPKVDAVRLNAKSESEMNAFTRMEQGTLCYRSDNDTLYAYDGSSWNAVGSGIQETDIDTLAELNAILTDATLADGAHTVDTDTQLSDAEVSTAFISENPDVDLDDTDDALLDGNNVFTGSNTFQNTLRLNYTSGSSVLKITPITSSTNYFGFTDGNNGSIFFQNKDTQDGLFTVTPPTNSTDQQFSFDTSLNTFARKYTLPNKNGTFAMLSDISGGGTTDHGALTGLGDDDHTQYHTDARAASWLSSLYADLDTDDTDDLVGAVSSTDNAIARFDGVTGNIVQNSGVTIDDSGNLDINGGSIDLGGGEIQNGGESDFTVISASTGLFAPVLTDAQEVSYSKGRIWYNDTNNEWRAANDTNDGFIVLNADGTGTDDQTASEVSFTPTGNTTSTDVQAALEEIQTEVDGISGGSISTENQNRIDNENLFKLRNTTSETPSAAAIEATATGDEGLKIFNYADGSEDLTITLDGSHSEGETLMYFIKSTTAQIDIVPDDGDISLIYYGIGSNNSLRLDELGQQVTILKTDVADEYIVTGFATPFETSFGDTVESAVDVASLITYYDAEQESGSDGATITTITDRQSANDATATNMLLDVTGNNKGFDFSTAGAFINAGQPSDWDTADSWSIGITFTGGGDNGSALFAKGDSVDANREVFLSETNTDSDFYYIVGGTGNSVAGTTNTTTGLHTIVMTYSGTALKIYVDGTALATQTFTDSTTNAYDLLVGARRATGNTGSAENFEGLVHSFTIHEAEMTSGEVTAYTTLLNAKYSD